MQMTKPERFFYDHLIREQLAFHDNVHYWSYRAIILDEPDGKKYVPDFLIIDEKGYIHLYTVRTHWHKAQHEMMREIADLYPWFTFHKVIDGEPQRVLQSQKKRYLSESHITKPNQWELDFASRLEVLRHYGDIKGWGRDLINLRLAYRTFYRPDFFYVDQNDRINFYEIKGFERDDAMVKIKVAASMFPFFDFTLVRRKKGEWHYESVKRVLV